jgi:hypothetical protein
METTDIIKPGEHKSITECRIGGGSNLISVLNLGEQFLTGVFPKTRDQPVTRGPLELVWCPQSGLLQMRNSFCNEEMFGDNYGYHSGLNASMVAHLESKARWIEKLTPLRTGDVVLDIGSNDATLLKSYASREGKRIGIDPTGQKFKNYYPPEILLVPDFFTASAFQEALPSGTRARVVTSISMFYDLERPLQFIQEVAEVLATDGIWHFEQSYMPAMLKTTSYDTVCHEHIEYYSLFVVSRMLRECGLRVLDVQMNDMNGGSFAVTACHENAPFRRNDQVIESILCDEEQLGLSTLRPYLDFEEKTFAHRLELQQIVRSLVADGKRILGYGASTKGNVLLQFCGFTAADIPAIAEVNPDKFGCFTPGSLIPIVSESEAKAMKPDYFLVLPWHFKDSIIRREQAYLNSGGKFIFPLPEVEII